MIQIALQASASAGVLIMLKITFVLALGWALHFALARANPRWRVLVWRGVAAAVVLVPMCLILPALKWTVVPSVDRIAPAPVTHTQLLGNSHEAATVSGSAAVTDETRTGFYESSIDWLRSYPAVPLFVIWAVVAAILANRYLNGIRAVRRLKRESNPADGCVSAGIDCKGAALRVSRRLSTPVVCGLARPAIIIPERMTSRDYADELPAIVAHELAHIEGRDIAWMNLIEVLAIMLWFHPLAWRMHKAHAAACETVCDGMAAEQVGNADLYSRTLARIALELVEEPRVCAIPMATSDVRRRLDALSRGITGSPLKRWVVRPMIACSLAMLLPFVALQPIQAETTATLSAEPQKQFTADASGKNIFFLEYAEADHVADAIHAELGMPERQIREKGFWMQIGDERRFHLLSIKLTRIEPKSDDQKARAEFELKEGDKTLRVMLRQDDTATHDGYSLNLQSVSTEPRDGKTRIYVSVRDQAEPPRFGRYDRVEITAFVPLNTVIVTAPNPDDFSRIRAIITKLDKPTPQFEVRTLYLDTHTTATRINLFKEAGLPEFYTDKQGSMKKADAAILVLDPAHVSAIDRLLEQKRLKSVKGPNVTALDGTSCGFRVESHAAGNEPELVNMITMTVSAEDGNILVKNLVVEERLPDRFRKTVSDLRLQPGRSILVKTPVSEGNYILIRIRRIATE